MKNQVDTNKQKQEQGKPNRLVLPLGQTIFLPQTAMGVSYIDKVRTRVYLDSLQRQPEGGPVCLRGFYEIDLEYHGLEGSRLYKHRVMLPLRVELPGDWLAPLEYEPEELHAVICKPMLRILSPYVLEFGAGLAVEYVGDRLYRQDRAGEEMKNRQMDAEAEQREMCERLESKYSSAKPAGDYHLPVWSGKAALGDEGQKRKKTAEKPAQSNYHLPVWSPKAVDVPAAVESEPVAAETESVVVETEPVVVESVSAAVESKPVEAESKPAAENEPAAAESKPAEAESVPVAAESEPAAAESKPAAVESKTVAAEQTVPQINPSKLRSMLTAAAISRLQNRGEVLTEKTAKNQAQEVILMNPPDEPALEVSVQVAEPAAVPVETASVAESEPIAATAAPLAEAAEEQTEIKAKANAGTGVETILTEKVAAEEPTEPTAQAVSAPVEEEPSVQEVNAPVEEETSARAVSAPVEEETSARAASAPVEEETSARAASAPVEDESAAEEPVSAGDLAEELAAEVAAAAEQNVADGNLAQGVVKAVNADGVRLRVGLRDAQQPRPVPQPAAGGANFCLKYYVVKPGDDPMSIALKHNVPLERLRDSNKALAGDLAVGMVLRIPC